MFNLIEYEELNSTNKFALNNIKNIEANTVIRAKTQTAGRGRFDRKWVSNNKNNCYISFVLKPDTKFEAKFQNLTQYLSIVLCEELTNYGIKPHIKWPNDVLINDKKIAGILSEISFSQNKLNGIVVGIGVNLNLTKEEIIQNNIPATSLNLETNKNIDADIFIQNLIERFFQNYEHFLNAGFRDFKEKYISFCNFIGKEIIIKNPEIQNIGTAKNILEDGTLEVLSPNGEIKHIISGDIILKEN